MWNTFEMSRNVIANGNWKFWCRLCAKEDTGNIDVLSEENITLMPAISARNHSQLLATIEEFFQVYIEQDDDLPHSLCAQCFSLVSTLVKFSERVKTVQDMYDAIQQSDRKTVDLKVFRENFNVFEDDLFMFNLSQTKSADENILADEDIEVPGDSVVKCESEMVFECKGELQDPLVDDVESIVSEVESVNSLNNSEETVSIEIDEDETVDSLNGQHSARNFNETCESGLLSSMEESMEDDFFCGDCSTQFQRLSNYRTHLKKKHGRDLEPLQCPECPKSFVGKHVLDRHIKSHRPLSERRIFPCPECGLKFQQKDYVAKHIKYVHEDSRPFICDECGEGCRTKSSLRMHMLVHSDFAPFECEVCKKTFKMKKRLNSHMDIHSSSKFTCSKCGLQLSSRITLRRHMVVHSDIKPHKCDYCGTAFKRAKGLKNHLILHSGLRLYPCEFCENTFTSRSSCRSHLKKIHLDEFAALEASGVKAYTKDVPKLAVLKKVIQSTEIDLKPVVQKRRVNFPLNKKTKDSRDTTTVKEIFFAKREASHLS
ncbi:zinc finger protein 260-like [Anastrepha ludens]|uniref:zinc finger protein 260-like n=1 Tax=Anastrepha ludens TaxID=28586 RepID=UPI0023B1285C|nr:zinc finger protein 260-like [Anastrepha ludens]